MTWNFTFTSLKLKILFFFLKLKNFSCLIDASLFLEQQKKKAKKNPMETTISRLK